MSQFHFDLVRPCGNCPFRRDIDFYLAVDRRTEIVDFLLDDHSFICHKTLDKKVKQQCAGALISLAKDGRLFDNFLFRLAAMAGEFDPDKLILDSPILTPTEFCENENSRRECD